MVNALRQQFSLTVEKTAKTRGYMSHQLLAHTLPKGKRPKEKELKRGQAEMKKGLIAIFCLLVLSFTSLPVSAQTRYRRYDESRRYEQRSSDWRYRDRNYNGRRWNRDRSFWDEHRDKLTTGIGAGAGAVIGGAVGGTKGAILGAIIGGGGAAAYTYGIRKDRRRYNRRY